MEQMQQPMNYAPSVPELEEAVLGACLIETNALPEAMKIMRPEMFYTDANRLVYEAAVHIYTQGGKVDILTVTEELKRRDTLEKVGGPYFIACLCSKVASSAHLEEHCHILRAYFLRRELISMLAHLQAKAVDMTVDAFDTVLEAQASLNALIDDSPMQSNLHTMPEVMELTLEGAVRRVATSVDGVTGVPSGLKDLDEVTGGWQPGNLIYTAARPGDGKTAIDLFFARNAAKAGVPVVFFTLEMTAREVGDRWMLSECDVDPLAWKQGRLSEADMQQARLTAQRMSTLPIRVDDTPGICIDEICLTAKSLYAKGQCGLVIVDYLQLCRAMEQGRIREQEVAECSRKLKALARRLSCPVIVSSQLNRQSEGRAGLVPRLADLRESGSIEQDADIVILLYHPKKAGQTTDKETGYPTDGLGIAMLAKHRNGSTSRICYGYNPSMTKIGDYVPTEEWMRRNLK